MSEQTLSLVAHIRARLHGTIRRLALSEFLAGAVVTVGAFLTVFGLSILLELGFWFEPGPRLVLLAVPALLLGAGMIGSVALPLLRLVGRLPGLSEEQVARRVGRRFPEVADRLIDLLHLADGRSASGSSALVEHAVSRLGRELEPIPIEAVEDFSGPKRWARLAFIPLALLGLGFLLAPGRFAGAAQRLLSPGAAFSRPAPFQLDVTPGNVEVVKGASVEIRTVPKGSAFPDRVNLLLRNDGEERIEVVELPIDSVESYRHTLVNLRQSLSYRIEARPVLSPWYEITVIDRPVVRALQVELIYPPYTRLPNRRLEPNMGDVTALRGTRAVLSIDVSGSRTATSALRFASGLEVPLTADGPLQGSFLVSQADTYQIYLANEVAVENADRITYTVRVQDDATPSIVLLEPEPVSNLSEALYVGLRARITDDFGFSALHLYFRLAESRFGETSATFVSVPLPGFEPSMLDQEIGHDWILQSTGLDLVPGDEIVYYLEVRDNDTVAGFKPARTPDYRLRFPSLAEQYRDLERKEDAAQSEMESLLRDSREMREEFDNLRDELRRKQDADWEDQRQLESISRRQQEMEQRVDDLSESLQRLTEQMQDNDLVSPETLEAFRELQRVMDEINTPELQEALRRLQEALQNLDLSRMQQSFEQFEFNEQQYQQRLQRALELFKRLRAEQMLDEAQRKAEELARRQQQLAEETERLQDKGDPQDKQGESDPDRKKDPASSDPEREKDSNNPDDKPERDRSAEDLANEQNRSSQDMEALEELLDQIREQFEDMRNVPDQQLDQVQDQLDQQNLPEQMQKNRQELLQDQLQKAKSGQQQMQMQLEELSNQLSGMKQMMNQEQIEVNIAALRRVLDDVLTLSHEQEDLRDNVRPVSPDNPVLRSLSQQQSELTRGLTLVSDTLQKLSEKIPQMSRSVQRETGDALLSMDRAVTEMAERQVERTTGHQKSSMMHLNNLALMLSDLMDQLMSGAGGMGGGMSMQQLLQQLQQMSGQQQQINEQIQQLLNDMAGNRMSVDQQQRLEQLRSQQEALRKQLEELSQDDEAAERILGDLKRIAEQMQESIQEMQRRELGRPLVRRQQEILTRLLDAQRSIRERGREERREGVQASENRRTPPSASPVSNPAERLRRDLLRALEAGYSVDYEELIKRYFEVLQDRQRPVQR